jgi:hypothetical protein
MTTPLAYLDPGSSSVFIQILAGGVAGFVMTLKLFGRRILRFLRIKPDDPEA